MKTPKERAAEKGGKRKPPPAGGKAAARQKQFEQSRRGLDVPASKDAGGKK
jgi:hypothetical protein